MAININKIRSLVRTNHDVPVIPFIALGAVLLVVGLLGAVWVFIKGNEAVYGVTRQVPWGLLISTYAYFAITSTGLAFIGGLGHAFGVKALAAMSRRIVLLAFIVLLAGFTQIGMELGHPFRLMYLMVLSPNFSAPIVWMGLFYTVELVILAIELLLVFNPSERSRALAPLVGFLALLVGVVAASNLGFVFGSLTARPFYHGIYFPAFLVASGIAGGAALLMVVYNVVYKLDIPVLYRDAMTMLGRLMGICITVMIFLLVWKAATSLYTSPQDAIEAFGALTFGPLALNFWVGEVILSLVVPMILLLVGGFGNMKTMGVGGLLFLIGMFFTRLDFIVAGQLPPMREGLEGAGVTTVRGLVTYTPAVGEWMIFGLGLGLFFFLYFMSERYLNLEDTSH